MIVLVVVGSAARICAPATIQKQKEARPFRAFSSNPFCNNSNLALK
jgi:hypothetical protein